MLPIIRFSTCVVMMQHRSPSLSSRQHSVTKLLEARAQLLFCSKPDQIDQNRHPQIRARNRNSLVEGLVESEWGFGHEVSFFASTPPQRGGGFGSKASKPCKSCYSKVPTREFPSAVALGNETQAGRLWTRDRHGQQWCAGEVNWARPGQVLSSISYAALTA